MHDPSSPCCFEHHPTFLAELESFVHKHGSISSSFQEAINNLEKLLIVHFYRNSPMFTPKHLGRAQGFRGFTIYWVHLVIPNINLSRTQFPKSYFYKTDGHISFLCLDSHISNYNDARLRKIAEKRLQDMIEVLKTH
jgi:hypothetical protein